MFSSSRLAEVKSTNDILVLAFSNSQNLSVQANICEKTSDKNEGNEKENVPPKYSNLREPKSLKRVSSIDLDFLSRTSAASSPKAGKLSEKLYENGSKKSASSFDLSWMIANGPGSSGLRAGVNIVKTFDIEFLSSIEPQPSVCALEASKLKNVDGIFCTSNLKLTSTFKVSLFDKKKDECRSPGMISSFRCEEGKSILDDLSSPNLSHLQHLTRLFSTPNMLGKHQFKKLTTAQDSRLVRSVCML